MGEVNNCLFCGAETERRKFCSEKCYKRYYRRETTRQYKQDSEDRRPKEKNEKTLDQVMSELQEQGKTYSEWKREQAMSRVVPIILSVERG